MKKGLYAIFSTDIKRARETSLKIHTSAIFGHADLDPINRVASKVIGKKGKIETVQKELLNHYDICPPLEKRIPRDVDDLTGRKIGRLTIVGLVQGTTSRWVARCACSYYTIRKARSITRCENSDDCCQACHRMKVLADPRRLRRSGQNTKKEQGGST